MANSRQQHPTAGLFFILIVRALCRGAGAARTFGILDFLPALSLSQRLPSSLLLARTDEIFPCLSLPWRRDHCQACCVLTHLLLCNVGRKRGEEREPWCWQMGIEDVLKQGRESWMMTFDLWYTHRQMQTQKDAAKHLHACIAARPHSHTVADPV